MSIEERYDEVRQLINVGKEKGYLLYDEVNEMLPSEITSAEDLDELFNAFGSAGIEIVDSDKAYRGDKDFDRDGNEDGPGLFVFRDVPPGPWELRLYRAVSEPTLLAPAPAVRRNLTLRAGTQTERIE